MKVRQSVSWHKSSKRVPAPNRHRWDRRELSMEPIDPPELCNIVLVSLSHSKAPVLVKRSQSVHLHITHEKLLKENLVVFTHIYTEMHFKPSLALSLTTSQEQRCCSSWWAGLRSLVLLVHSCSS